jgi:transposase
VPGYNACPMSSAPSACSRSANITLPRAEYEALQAQVHALKTQLDWFKRQLFGSKSEKRRVLDPAIQADLLARLAQAPAETPAPATEQITYTRRKAKQRSEACLTEQGLRFDETVPVEVIEVPAPELSGPEAAQYIVIDEKITRRLAQRPGSYVVLEYHRPVVKHLPSQTLTTVAAPSAVFEGALADVSLLAGLLVDKFAYHLPLYRQHQRLRDAGITLSRATLTSYVQRSIGLLRPIYDAQLRHVLQSRVLAMDETPHKAGRTGKGKLNAVWYWPIYGEDDEVCFTYSASRGKQHVEALLKEFEGTLLTDGYAAYERFSASRPAVTHAQCWAHARRYFERAAESEPAAVAEALERIGALYRIESDIRKNALEGQAKLGYRSRHSVAVVEGFFDWVDQQRHRLDLLPRDPFAKALGYAAEREASLRIFLGDPDVPIDTNHLERALRVVPMGRRNWLFNWTEVGAEQVGVIQSLLVTCRLHSVDPYTYLVDVLQRVSLHPARDVEALTPRQWKAKFSENPLKSDLAGLGK